MPVFVVPSSHGAAPLREGNPCHVPGGSPAGGRFAHKGSAGCDPGLFQPELVYGPPPGLSRVILNDDSDATGAILGNHDPEDIARSLVEGFPIAMTCDISSEGGGIDKEAYRDSYNEWRDEQIEAQHERYIEGKYEEWGSEYDSKTTALETAHDEVREFVHGMNPDNTDGHLPVHQLTFEETARIWAVAGLDENSVDGFEIDAEHEKALTTLLAEQYPGQEVKMHYYDESYASDFYSDYETFDSWMETHGNDEGDNLASFEDWVADVADGDSNDGEGKVTFTFHSTENDRPLLMRRVFLRDDSGDLKVEHDWMEVADGTPPLGKLMLRNAVKTYQQLGIDTVETHAGLDVGGYAWVRLGFRPVSTGNLIQKMAYRLEVGIGQQPENKPVKLYYDDDSYDPKTRTRTTRRVETTVSPTQLRGIKRLLDKARDGDYPAYFWATVDAHTRGTTTRDGVSVPAKFSIGKFLLLGQAYNARLDLSSIDTMNRLRKMGVVD